MFVLFSHCLCHGQVKMVSSLTCDGLPEVWETVLKYQKTMIDNEQMEIKRALQRKKWMWNYISDRLLEVRIHHLLSIRVSF